MSQKNLESLTIHSFRGIRGLELKDLGQINILVGVNNSGKTSVLEALSIYCHPLDIGAWLSIARQREQGFRISRTPLLNSLEWLFARDATIGSEGQKSGCIHISSNGCYTVRKMNASYEVIEGMYVSDKQRRPIGFYDPVATAEDEQLNEEGGLLGTRKGLDLKINLDTLSLDSFIPGQNIAEDFQLWENERFFKFSGRKNPSLLTSTVTPSSHRSEIGQLRLLSEARLHDFKGDVLVLLRQMDPSISDLEILLAPGSMSSNFNIFIQHDELGLAPLSTFGDGVRRLLHIALQLAAAKGGILMIDEIESTIHTEALQNSFRLLIKWCNQMDIQLFATTHSLEAVDALIAGTTIESGLVLYRIEPKSGQTRVIRHPWDRLKRLREDLGQEVRW